MRRRCVAISRRAAAVEPQTLTTATATAAVQEARPAREAVGRVSAETVCPYPPGVPALVSGARVTREALAFLERVARDGGQIDGAADPSLRTLQVVAEPARDRRRT